MAKIVELPDGREAEFPDDMDNAAIGAVLAKQFPAPKQQAAPQQPAPQQPAYQPYQEGSDPYADVGRFGENPGTGAGGAEFHQGIASTPARLVKSLAQMAGVGQNLRQHPVYSGVAQPVADVINKSAQVSDTGFGTAGRIIGDVAATVAPMGAVQRLTPAIQAAKGFGSGVGRFGLSAGEQAAYAALLSPDQQGEAALLGALGGGAGHVLSKALGSRLVTPSAEGQKLLDAGVPLTPGQAAGKATAMGKLEQWASTNPVAGLAINPARQRSVQDFNRVLINNAIEQISGQPVPKNLAPRDAYYHASDLISNQYDEVLPLISATPSAVKKEVGNQLKEAMSTTSLTPTKEWEKANAYVVGRLKDLDNATGGPPGQPIAGVHLKQIDAEVGRQARDLAKSLDPKQRSAAEAWFVVQDGLRDAMRAGAPEGSDAATRLAAANDAYKQLVPLRKALGNNDVMTPRALRGALAPHQSPLVEAANATLPNTVANSGTAERVLANALPALLMSGGAGVSGLGYDTLGAGMAAAGALGSRSGARALLGQTAGQRFFRENPNAMASMLAAALRQRPNKDEE